MQLLTAQANSAAMLGDRRAREIFVGNLNRGLVSAEMLRELFNAVLANMVPDPMVNPPVITARLDASGKYGFVELRSPELASAATQLHKMELCGKPMTVERAKGYQDPTAQQKIQLATVGQGWWGWGLGVQGWGRGGASTAMLGKVLGVMGLQVTATAGHGGLRVVGFGLGEGMESWHRSHATATGSESRESAQRGCGRAGLW